MDTEFMLTLAGTFTAIVVAITLAKALGQRISARRPGSESTEELAELRHRLTQLERDTERLAELEERVDFTERLLAAVRQPANAMPRAVESFTGERTDP